MIYYCKIYIHSHAFLIEFLMQSLFLPVSIMGKEAIY